MHFQKEKGVKTRVLKKMGLYRQGFWKQEGLHAVLQKTGLRMIF